MYDIAMQSPKTGDAPADTLVPPRDLIDFVGGSDFRVIGAHLLRLLIAVGGLRATDRVLDVGCGSGRVAVPLMDYLTTGTYDGFDVGREAIAWCERAIAARDPRFHFHHADLANGAYNAAGATPAAAYTFPYADAAFDFIFLTSVFTHLLPDARDRYLAECARTLAPGGRICASFFLLTPETERAMAAGRAAHQFPVIGEGYRASDPTVPEAAVAYDEAAVRARYARCGLRIIEPVWFGTWSGRTEGATHQDVIVAERAPAGVEDATDPVALALALAEARIQIGALETALWRAETALWTANKRVWEAETRLWQLEHGGTASPPATSDQ